MSVTVSSWESEINFLLLSYDILVVCCNRDVVPFAYEHMVLFEKTFFCKIVQIQ